MRYKRRHPSTNAALLRALPLACAMLAGCGIPLFPIPIIKYAPQTTLLPEIHAETAPLIASINKDDGRRQVLLLRSGQARSAPARRTDADILSNMPSSALKQEFSSAYVAPFKFRQIPAGQRHYYNFTITPEFERATSLYLNGQGVEAVTQLETILANKKNEPTLVWQASYLKVNVLIMMGQPDAAERETVQLERLEVTAMGGNHTSRALRAEVKYWAGDLDGALEDAAQVTRSLGDWRYLAAYSIPPLDQVELARCVTAQARSNIVLGLALLAKGRAREALPWLELANQTMNNVMFTSRHPINALYFQPPEEIFWGRGMSLVALGTALLSIDPSSPRAAETFGRAQEYFNALGFRAGAVLIETFKAHSLLVAGNPSLAAQQAAIGAAEASKLGLIEYVWRLEALRGRALIELNRFEDAERALRRAQSVVDLMAGTMLADDAKVRFGVGKEGITHDLIQIDLRKQDFSLLFEDMERGRARAFVAQLTNRVVAQDRGGEWVPRIRALDRRIQQERQRKNALSAEGELDISLEQRLLEERAELVAKLRTSDPDLADVLAVSAINLSAVRARLPANALMVYAVPSIGNGELRLLFIGRDQVQVRQLNMNAAQLQSLLNDFNQTVASAARDTKRQRETLGAIRRGLNVDSWPKAELVYFVPSGPSYFLPWAALDTDFSVAVLPTGGWIARTPLAASQSTRAIVVGDPEFGGALPQLPGAREEARAVSGIYAAPALIGTSATEASLRKAVGSGVDVLHLATHALYDPIYPMQSSLIMTDGKRAAPLTAESLFARPISARLVILSACETGMGEVVSGDDLLGLTRSFYLGGATSVVSSLWPVEDEATRIFMETFHEKSRGGSYGAAWLAARDAVRTKGFPPSAYGAFILGGSLGN